MAFMTQHEKQQLREAIRHAEAKTSGEIVTVMTHSSDDYAFYPTLWASLLAIASPLLPQSLNLSYAPLGIIELQFLIFILLLLILRWTPLKMRLIPRAIQQEACSRRAREQFVAQNLYTTQQHTGVLLYVSVAERRVILLADRGIHVNVTEGTWDSIVQQFTQQIRAGKIAQGFIEAVGTIGEQLAKHFPAQSSNPNELPDHLIEL